MFGHATSGSRPALPPQDTTQPHLSRHTFSERNPTTATLQPIKKLCIIYRVIFPHNQIEYDLQLIRGYVFFCKQGRQWRKKNNLIQSFIVLTLNFILGSPKATLCKYFTAQESVSFGASSPLCLLRMTGWASCPDNTASGSRATKANGYDALGLRLLQTDSLSCSRVKVPLSQIHCARVSFFSI